MLNLGSVFGLMYYRLLGIATKSITFELINDGDDDDDDDDEITCTTLCSDVCCNLLSLCIGVEFFQRVYICV